MKIVKRKAGNGYAFYVVTIPKKILKELNLLDKNDDIIPGCTIKIENTKTLVQQQNKKEEF